MCGRAYTQTPQNRYIRAIFISNIAKIDKIDVSPWGVSAGDVLHKIADEIAM